MSQTPISVTYTLEQILGDIKDSVKEVNRKIDTLDGKIEHLQRDINGLQVELTSVKADIKALDTKIETGLETLEISFKEEIKALDTKVEGLSKRVDNQEFTNRGILIALVVAILGGAAKLFGAIGSP
jgi:peptidoglycan hydrolase CwlO-like protein